MRSNAAANLLQHIRIVKSFNRPMVVAVNKFFTDTEAEIQAVKDICKAEGVEAIMANHWEHGGEGAKELGEKVIAMLDESDGKTGDLGLTYDSGDGLWAKARAVAKNIYGADGIMADKKVRNLFQQAEDNGFANYPVCIAKTQYSFSSDPNLKGAPTGHTLPIRDLRISGGSEFAVVICGDIMTMPGLPRVPAANAIDLNDKGEVVGLF